MEQYKILVIDDMTEIVEYFEDIKEILAYENIKVEFEYMHNVNDFSVEKPYDILMFDCNFNAARYDADIRNKVGFNLIKQYRQNNTRTKIIFYSSSFNIDEPHQIPFNHKHYFEIINELNVYRLVYKNDSRATVKAIKEAINDLDIIMISLEKMASDYDELNMKFELNDGDITLNDLIYEMRMDGENAEKFRRDVVDLITNYMSKFDLNTN
ncbi:hypothetical protein N0M98_11840 [Paenibacillus doosanensis]|uniref:hypothetical protein n=1 Tax=Paenibacillus doosanensis TaxID=1229154 RepID=UPI002180428B|nr:hypothetical protein [Paenibacillus doosanensis]MCS7460835.1 hypothetical protein [Paenibacillus doosanensis]